MDITRLTREHRDLVARAAALVGLAESVKTGPDADEALGLISALDRRLVDHLEAEDREVYPLLMADPDPQVRTLAAAAFEDVGSLVGAWSHFAGYWTRPLILSDPRRFAETAGCILQALMLRVELEEDILYPAARRAAFARLTRTPAA
jgi:hypothetical protein